jgi:prepilin-type processing-associated H-X9-DG protein
MENGFVTAYTLNNNFFTVRHNGKANSGFVDGHVELDPWWYCTNVSCVVPIAKNESQF